MFSTSYRLHSPSAAAGSDAPVVELVGAFEGRYDFIGNDGPRFWLRAEDNRRPEPQTGRTETHFVLLADTAAPRQVASEGFGVDLVPEYFRSQRQMIQVGAQTARTPPPATACEPPSRRAWRAASVVSWT